MNKQELKKNLGIAFGGDSTSKVLSRFYEKDFRSLYSFLSNIENDYQKLVDDIEIFLQKNPKINNLQNHKNYIVFMSGLEIYDILLGELTGIKTINSVKILSLLGILKTNKFVFSPIMENLAKENMLIVIRNLKTPKKIIIF